MVSHPEPPPQEIEEYWNNFASAFELDPLEHPFRSGVQAGVIPRMDRELLRICQQARAVRKQRSTWLVVFFVLGWLLPLLPPRMRVGFYERAVSVFRPDGRLRRWTRRIFCTSAS
jgi:hypothetical protein